MSIQLSIRADPRFLVVTDVLSFVLLELVLFAASRLRVLLSPLAFVVLSAVSAAGFAADVAIWHWTGIRSVEVDEEELTILRGPSLSSRTYARKSIARLTVRRFLGVGTVRFRTNSGVRVRIPEHAFPREEFRRFLTLMETWER